MYFVVLIVGLLGSCPCYRCSFYFIFNIISWRYTTVHPIKMLLPLDQPQTLLITLASAAPALAETRPKFHLPHTSIQRFFSKRLMTLRPSPPLTSFLTSPQCTLHSIQQGTSQFLTVPSIQQGTKICTLPSIRQLHKVLTSRGVVLGMD